MTQAIRAYWNCELNLILLADESTQRENKNVLLALPHEYSNVKHSDDCTMCSILKRVCHDIQFKIIADLK